MRREGRKAQAGSDYDRIIATREQRIADGRLVMGVDGNYYPCE
ncbi:MAG TPA: hypothetical protein VJP80_06725 [Candidatus Saccharimonadales bacterium]|nr:hypothetical protein [Candidatus Saccharimonadales bacterium]